MDRLNEMYDFLIERGIATQEEVELVTRINGLNIESLNAILYTRTGYRNKKQFEMYAD